VTRFISAAWLGLMAAIASAQGTGVGGFQYYGITHVSWWFDEYTYATATASRNDLAATSANWAAVLATWYQPNLTASTIAPSSTQTPTDAAVIQAITEFHNKGIKVMLKPHVDVNDANNSWRGSINPLSPDAWFTSYTSFITHYAQLAASNGVEMLCIGTELKTVSGASNVTRWYQVIDAIKAVYSGKLTYASNATSAGDEFTSVSFWDRLDLIGLDGYFQLTNQLDPTLAQLVAAWQGNANRLNIVSAVSNLASAHQKPIIFTEIGYKSVAGANIAPWDYGRPGTYDPTEQRNCMDAAFTAWTPYSQWLLGFFWWAWPVQPPAATDEDYNPRGKPAAALLKAWQSPVNAANGVTNAADYKTDALSPGAIISLWGNSLSTGILNYSGFPLSNTMLDTSAFVNGVPAPLFFVSPGQVNAQLPYEVTGGTAVAEVDSNGGIALTQIKVTQAGPGIFTINGQGTGDGSFLNAVNFATVSSQQAIAAGDYLAIYCTGLGAVTPPAQTGQVPASPLRYTSQQAEVTIDGQALSTYTASVLAPGFVGLYQVNTQIPTNLPPGQHQLQIFVNGAGSNIVTLATK